MTTAAEITEENEDNYCHKRNNQQNRTQLRNMGDNTHMEHLSRCEGCTEITQDELIKCRYVQCVVVVQQVVVL